MKQLNFFKVTIAILLLFHIVSCEKNAFFNAGENVSQEILLDKMISSIEVNTMLDITLVQDSINKAIVTCGENLLSDINIFVKDDILHLNNTIKYNWSRSYEKVKLELHLISIPQLNIRKPAYITTRDTFKTNEFFLIDWGEFTKVDVTLDVNSCAIDVSSDDFGHYTVRGKAVSAKFYGKGSSFIYANELRAQNCTVKQLSIGDIYINVSNVLRVSLLSSGNIYYSGNPNNVVIDKCSSTGKLIHISDE